RKQPGEPSTTSDYEKLKPEGGCRQMRPNGNREAGQSRKHRKPCARPPAKWAATSCQEPAPQLSRLLTSFRPHVRFSSLSSQESNLQKHNSILIRFVANPPRDQPLAGNPNASPNATNLTANA